MKKYISFILLSFLFSQCSNSNFGTLKIDSPSLLESATGHSLKMKNVNSFLRFFSGSQSKTFVEIPINKAFLRAQKGNPNVAYRMAAFRISDSTNGDCRNQTITGSIYTDKFFSLRGTLSGNGCQTDYQIYFTLTAEDTVEFTVTLSDKSLNRIAMRFGSDETEQFFGFGEQYSYFNMKGKKPFLLTEEQGIGRGDQPITAGANITAGAGGNQYTSYAPVPHYITTKNRSLFFENTGYSKFDLSDPNEVSFEFWDNNLRGTIWVADNPLKLIELYTKKTGRFEKLPDWAYGTWMGLQGGSVKVTRIVDSSIEAGNPVTALWIQDWVGRRKTNFGDQLAWRWYAKESGDAPVYPEFKEFCSSMNKKGVKVLGYINSFLADKDPKRPEENFENPMLDEAKKKGYLVKDKNGNDYMIQTVGFPAYLIDLTNPDAVRWTKDIIRKNLIDAGLSGWMADFGEWLPFDAKLHSGVDASLYHNVYPVDWARINREAIREAGKEGQIIFFTRAGYSYSNRYSTMFWEGDQMVSFGMNDGLASAITGLISGGVSGIAFNHSDIGGYTTINNPLKNYHRTRELLLRWAEMSAFTLTFRSHEGNRPDKNYQVYSDEKVKKEFARLGKLHFALKDYLSALADEAHEKGYPVVRATYLHYPKDRNTYDLKHQFLLGEDVLVFPVLENAEVSVIGYLPAGKWENIWTGEIIEGGKSHNAAAPLGKPAAFLKVGGKWSERIRKSVTDAGI